MHKYREITINKTIEAGSYVGTELKVTDILLFPGKDCFDNNSALNSNNKIPLLMCTLHQEGIFYFVPDEKVLRISTIVVNIHLKCADA